MDLKKLRLFIAKAERKQARTRARIEKAVPTGAGPSKSDNQPPKPSTKLVIDAAIESVALASPAALYTDGGVAGSNPSSLGGSWCFCHVDDGGNRTLWRSGTITPEIAGTPTGLITNNYTELLAAVMGLESLPDGWAGTVFVDSAVTSYRVGREKSKFLNIPQKLIDRLYAARSRLGKFSVVLIGGHPTAADLKRGSRANGTPVSKHNVFCDQMCVVECRKLFK